MQILYSKEGENACHPHPPTHPDLWMVMVVYSSAFYNSLCDSINLCYGKAKKKMAYPECIYFLTLACNIIAETLNE
jgi:hypothetical protein